MSVGLLGCSICSGMTIGVVICSGVEIGIVVRDGVGQKVVACGPSRLIVLLVVRSLASPSYHICMSLC